MRYILVTEADVLAGWPTPILATYRGDPPAAGPGLSWYPVMGPIPKDMILPGAVT